jgi:calreticulin
MLYLLAILASVASGKVYFKETFGSDWQDRWTIPTWKKDEAGAWEQGSGKHNPSNVLRTSQDAKFYAAATTFDAFSNKDKDLVVQMQVAFPQTIDCGGGYLKVFGEGVDPIDYTGESAYNIMFGPDICGSSTKKVHVIFNDKDSGDNLDQDKSKETPALNDKKSHVYTLVVHPDNTYAVHVDGEEKTTGSLKEDWSLLEPKEIKDPDQSKPDDWVDEAMIDDPEDVKPEGYDDIPKTIVDPDAEMPEDWDEEDDGEWEAPMIDNPEYKGPWKAKRISNPDYKGPWEHPMIPNPDYVDKDDLYEYTFAGIGIDIWQVKSGTEYSNIIITDSLEEANAFREETFKQDEEQAALDKEAEEAAAKAKAEAEAAAAEEEDDDDEEDEDEEEEEGHDEL